MSMNSAQIRHANFMALYRKFRNENAHLPERGMLKLFAGRLGLSERYLSHIRCNRKNIGSNLARTIETALGLRHGWMDREHLNDTLSSRKNDEAETLFLETVKMLYRSEPDTIRQVVMDLLRKKLGVATT